MQRFKRSLVDICDVRILHPENVDLERVNLLQRVLPASVHDRGFVFDFLLRLTKVDIELGAVNNKVRYETAMQKRPPMNTRVQ